MTDDKTILIVGGAGVVGKQAIQFYRNINRNNKLYVGGRRKELAAEVALEAGNASPLQLDVTLEGLGIEDSVHIDAVVMLAPDPSLNGLKFAQKRRVPYMSIVTGLVELGGEIAHFANTRTSPILLSSHWAASAATFLAMSLSKQFESVSAIEIGVVLDPEDFAGPASYEDMERIQQGPTAGLGFSKNERVWFTKDSATRVFQTIDGRDVEGTTFSTFDTVSLHAVTGASNIRFDIASDMSSSRNKGGPAAAEIIVTATGLKNGKQQRLGKGLEFSLGQAALTGLSSSILLAAFLERIDSTDSPTLYLPEKLGIETGMFIDDLVGAGVELSDLNLD